jgi:hypothetical protein
MDDFPVIVPEDDGFAIYLNDERVDWYNNEADAEGVALSMVDKELNDESFFDRPLEESANLKETFNSPNGYSPLYTGLAYKDVYSNIISSFVGQIWDGIGEGDGKEGRIFNYYYKELDYIRSGSIDGEFVIYADIYDLDQLIRGIWRVAQIERSDEGTTDKNMYYDYLDANWSDICKLQGTLSSIAKKWSQDHSNFKNEPWSDEKKAANDTKIAKAKADEESKKAAEQKAKEDAEAKKEADFNTKINTIIPDAKDEKRAKDAWGRSNGNLYKLFQALLSQLNKIEDIEKAKRRIVAFYKEALKHSDAPYFTDRIENFKDLIDRDIDL